MKDFYKTSDTAFAGYLMVEGFTVLGCVDDNTLDERGNTRLNFYFTHSDEDIRQKIDEYCNELRDKYQYETKSFREYFLYLKHLRKLTRNPIDPKKFEKGE